MSTGWTKIYPPGSFRGRSGWHVRGKDMYGRPIEGRLPPEVTTAGAAERLGRQLLKRSNSRPPPPVEAAPARPDDHSFEAAARAYQRIRRPRPADWERIEKLIACPAIGPVDVARLTTDQAATFATATKPGVKPDTLNREVITPYGAVLHYAHELGWRDNPTIRRFGEQEDAVPAVKPAEVDRLVAHVDATATYKAGAHQRRDRQVAYKVALIEFLRLRGTRISDVLKLHRARDLDLPGMQVRLTIGKARDKIRWAPLSPKVTSLLANLPPCDGGYLFPWRSRSSVYKWWKPLRDRLGLTTTPHQFRHALGEEAMDAELDPITLMNLGAWASLESARKYARPSRRKLRAADAARARAARAEDGPPAPANDNADQAASIEAGKDKA